MNVPLLQLPEFHWICPNCDETDVTYEQRPHSRYHTCRGLRGLSAPFIADGTKAKVEAVDREDYVGTDIPQRDGEGNVVMAIVTTRDNGQDCDVLAPTATGKRGDYAD